MQMTSVVLLLGLNVMWTSISYASPLLNLKNDWEQNVLESVVTSACPPNEPCWGWLPVEEVRRDAIVPKDFATAGLHVRRQIADTNPVLESWKDNGDELSLEIKPSAPTTRQVPNRINKKDVFVPRSWSVGGMPFSVLYMNPHGPRSNHDSSTTSSVGLQEPRGTIESSTPPFGQANYRLAMRNGTSRQSRRHYSIIPQLFISYGWGSLGK